MDIEIRIPIRSEADIVAARQQGRILAEKLGFNGSDLTVIATAISEVARNIVQYAISGEILLSAIRKDKRVGIQMIAQDQGPGITDVEKALEDGYSTGLGLGLGLPGARRLVDEFIIETQVGKGTAIIMKKWIRTDHAQGW